MPLDAVRRRPGAVAGVELLYCLSAQAYNYFQQKGGSTEGSANDQPTGRRERCDKSGRRSLVLLKMLV